MLKSLNAMGDYTEDVMSRAIAIAAGNRDETGNLVDFCSFSDGSRANRLTMCYCDWQALEIIRPLVPGFGDSLTKAEDGGDFYVDTILGTYYVSLNDQKEPFNDVNVRKALSLAIDRDYVANTIMQGTYTPAYNLVGPGIVPPT